MKARKITECTAMAVLAIIATLSTANAQVAHKTVPKRLIHQRERINQGVKSRRLTYQQASKLHAADARVARQAQADRRKHHGTLTAKEHRHLNHELTHISHKIHEEKHPGHK